MDNARRKAFGLRGPSKLLNGPGATGFSFGLLALLCTGAADAQVFVSNAGNGTISEYSTSLATVNTALVSGLNNPGSIAVSGSDLFVLTSAPGGGSQISEYTTSGATVNTALVSGLSFAGGLAVSGSDLFVLSGNSSIPGTISEYTTSGATVNGTLVSGLSGVSALAASGSNLFVVESSGPDSGSVAEYTTSGATVNATLLAVGGSAIAVSGSKLFLSDGLTKVGEFTTAGATVNANLIGLDEGPYSIAATGSDVYVAALAVPLGAGYVGEYDSTSGAPVNFTQGVFLADGIAVEAPTPVPLPASVWLLLGGLGALGAIARRQRHAV